MFAPGRIIFLRPLKSTSSRKRSGKKLTVKSFDAVWITAQELAGEGILVSPAMLTDHLIEATVQEAIAHSIIFHPNNPSDPAELAKQRALAARMEKLVSFPPLFEVELFSARKSRPLGQPLRRKERVDERRVTCLECGEEARDDAGGRRPVGVCVGHKKKPPNHQPPKKKLTHRFLHLSPRPPPTKKNRPTRS